MTLENLRENIQSHTPYVRHGDDKYISLSKVMADIDSLEETCVVKPKVELTQAQVNFLKTFKSNKRKALYYIARAGFRHPLTDGNDVRYTESGVDGDKDLVKLIDKGTKFSFNKFAEFKIKLIDALVNGYTVKEEVPLYVCVLPNNNVLYNYLVVRRGGDGLLYISVASEPQEADTFTEEEAREQLDWIIPHMERVV